MNAFDRIAQVREIRAEMDILQKRLERADLGLSASLLSTAKHALWVDIREPRIGQIVHCAE
ncbi:hypothetical protein [Sphingomonas sp. SUN039]|uniref:hypothetical protein n=1 Tax=Sphingomonas sp. SUN039 TaxID=2937787 RepID=UPI002164DA75|nr:hypothetical protein [Sphingomonas sp. SUN039]UVO53051.1 hypothetical protein M0209_02550 [Sphingomonas sp. SUN039]